MDGIFENIVDWVHSNLPIDLTNCTVDSQVSIPEDVIQVVNDMIKQEVTSDGIQFRNMHHHKSILLNLFANNDLYDDNSYASNADWKIGKKPETGLKIEFDIDINDDEINDLNDTDAVSPQGWLS